MRTGASLIIDGSIDRCVLRQHLDSPTEPSSSWTPSRWCARAALLGTPPRCISLATHPPWKLHGIWMSKSVFPCKIMWDRLFLKLYYYGCSSNLEAVRFKLRRGLSLVLCEVAHRHKNVVRCPVASLRISSVESRTVRIPTQTLKVLFKITKQDRLGRDFF